MGKPFLLKGAVESVSSAAFCWAGEFNFLYPLLSDDE